jgi:hypothetical protein
MSVPVFQVGPWGVLYIFYNHARRLRLEKLSYIELSRSSNGYLKPGPGGGFVSEVKRPLRNRFGSEVVTNL